MKEIKDFEEQSLAFLERLQEINKNSYYLLKPLARELFETYQKAINDYIEGKV